MELSNPESPKEQKDFSKPDSSSVIYFLEKELKHMEDRNPLRRYGYNDPKYRVLKRFLLSIGDSDFYEAYEDLEDREKFVIISRLENQELITRTEKVPLHDGPAVLPYEFVADLRKCLLGEDISFAESPSFEEWNRDLFEGWDSDTSEKEARIKQEADFHH